MLSLKKKLVLQNIYLKLFISEFVGTFILLFLGTCVSLQFALNRFELSSDGPTWGWGLSVTMAVFVTGGVSGAHINPAISLGFFSIRQLKLLELLIYWPAQYLGAFLGSASAVGIYYDALKFNDGAIKESFKINSTAALWSTYPQQYCGTTTLFFDQVMSTMMLMICILAISDEKNMNIAKGLRPFCVGLAVICVMFSLSHNSGAAMNPARDFSPRVLAFASGWDYDIFRRHNYFFWIPLVAPHIGAVLGAYLYLVVIEWNLSP